MARTALIRVLRENLKTALRHGHVAEAESLLHRLQAEEPLSRETRGLELEVLIAARRWAEAKRLAGQLATLFPASARIRYLAGRVAYHDKNYAAALEHFTEADRLHSHWSMRLWRGRTHTQRGEYAAAESLLVGLAGEHPQVARDLAWLYERRGEPERALRHLDAYLSTHPDDRFALAQQLRLRASAATPEELVQEVEELQELGEDIAPEMLPAYVQRLLEIGQGAEVRRFVDAESARWTPEVAVKVAWECYRLQAYDLALRLFLAGLPHHVGDYKYLSALESAARLCQRTDDVAAAYGPLAPEHRQLYGRLKALERRSRRP